MAAIGCLTATTQIGQPNIRVAGFQAITHSRAVNNRSQSCSVAEMGLQRAAMTSDGLHRGYQCNSAWGRGNNTIIPGGMPNSGSQSGGWLGNFLQIFRPSSATAFNNFGNNFGEDVHVDNRARQPAELLEPEPEAAKVSDQTALEVVEVKKAVQNANVAEKALDKSSTVATSALDKVGDVLRTTGLEVDLDVGLKELGIKELVLRDLTLVLSVKTKPQPQPQPPQAQAEKGEGNGTA